ncbi:thiomuracin/GE37468 family thiazolyl RiPP peptide [Nocardia sp. NPDC051052]|uniref:thiomuracin/GE37468 family thiazolyl RiPP peptide n=1 Tax=Nocardia sp. NPDC051052 TaxID=3364322 RepID=UPI0037BC5614
MARPPEPSNVADAESGLVLCVIAGGIMKEIDLNIDDLDVTDLDSIEPVDVGLESLSMGHGLTELGASCCCSASTCSSCCAAPI